MMHFWHRRHRHRWEDVPWEYAQLRARWCSACHDIEFDWGGWVNAGKRTPEDFKQDAALRLLVEE